MVEDVRERSGRALLAAAAAAGALCLAAISPLRAQQPQSTQGATQQTLAPQQEAPSQDNAQPSVGFGQGPSQQIANPGLGPLFGAPYPNEHLFGDWGGVLPWLDKHGINVALDWLTENAGNITGGQRERFDFSGQVALEVDLDLERLLGLDHTAFHVMIVNGNGRNLSDDALGDDLGNVQEIYGSRGNVVAHMVYAYAEKSFLHDRIDLAGGWLPVGTYFAASPLYCRFMNVLFCGNPHPLPNYPGEPDWPSASFGGQIRVLPAPELYLQAGVFSVDTSGYGSGGGGISGWAWADPHKSGVSIPVEAGWVPAFGHDKLVGHYKIGIDHDTHEYPDVETTGASHNRDMEYALVDQMLQRQGPGPTDGLIVFGGYVHADHDVSPLSDHAFGGITSTAGLFGRPKDTISASFQWIEMSANYTRAQEAAAVGANPFPLTLDGFGPAYGPQNSEQVVEFNYNIAVYRGVSVMPDFQYIIRPGASTNTPDAAVLGFRTNVLF